MKFGDTKPRPIGSGCDRAEDQSENRMSRSEPPHRLDRVAIRLFALALVPSIAGAPRAEDRKPETPEHAHELRVTCAGAAAAAVERTDLTHASSEKDRADAQTTMRETRDEALASGDRIGRSVAQVGEEIDRSRDGLLRRFSDVANRPDALAKEQVDLGRVLINCALVEAIERRNGQQATPAPGNPSR